MIPPPEVMDRDPRWLAAWAMLAVLHSNVPEDKRPTGWASFSDAQILRAGAAVDAVLALAQTKQICGACGQVWTGEKCGQAENGWPHPVCYPVEATDGTAEWGLVNLLREAEGDSVTLICDNPDFNGQPNAKVICNGWWTDWQDREFADDTVLGALRAAITQKAVFDATLELVHIETVRGLWRRGEHGYTGVPREAAVYTRASAEVIIANLGPEKRARLLPIKRE